MKYKKNPRHQRCGSKANNFPVPRLPKDYPWKVIAALKTDLDSFINGDSSKILADIIRNKDVSKLLELSETWGLQSINLMNWSNVSEISALYQLSTLLKRFPFSSNAKMRKDAAINKFVEAENECFKFNQFGWKKLACPETEEKLSIYTYAQAFIARVLGQIVEPTAVMEWSRHGPGATLSTLNGSNSLYAKYSNWPYDCTEQALVHARTLIENDERWLGALEDSYRDRYNIPKHYILDRECFWSRVFNVVEGNRVTFVPKDARTERTIAIEPTCNLMLQLGVDGFIRNRLKRFHIDLDDQTKNQKLSRLGSINNSYATIDLKAASDTVSLKLVQLLLPPQWRDYLMSLRSPYGLLNDEIFFYEKISSMGNGYTFALESLIFGSIIYGVIRHLKGRVLHDDFCVYGDDLIIRTEYAEILISCLNDLGFTVNSEKTFLQGPVRESCGTDWFRGHLIRPVFIDELPTNIKQLWSARNRLQRALELHWCIINSNTVSVFDSWSPEILHGFAGPKSDTDYDSYRHIAYPVYSRYVNGLWKFKRITTIPKPFKGQNFLFRKLMAQLRVTNPRQNFKFKDLVSKSGGSCFTVTQRNRVIMSVVTSRTSVWCDEYTSDWL